MITRSVIAGCGNALPAQAVTNDQLAQRVDTSDAWIQQRTGIKQRYLAADDEKTSDLAVRAARQALENAGIDASAIDAVVVATTTPDYTFPATAVLVQAALGIDRGFAFDVQAACSGFIYALATADNFIRTGQVKHALVIGAETFSRLVDWNDRNTCVLFGDGAGAVVLSAMPGVGDKSDRGILSTHLHAEGKHWKKLYTSGGPGSSGTVGKVVMEGQEVFRQAVIRLAEVVDEALQANNMQPDEIDWLVPHQANKRIIDGTAKKLHLSSEKVILTISEHANTSAASIPLALSVAVQDGRIKPGHVVLLDAMGAGLTWAAAMVRI
ncbi:MAG: beta-ketoacyl-ACP synthase III [Alphaproteobacteria bacterium]